MDVPDRQAVESHGAAVRRCRRRDTQVYTLDVSEILDGESSVDVPVTIAAENGDTSFGSSAASFPGAGGIASP